MMRSQIQHNWILALIAVCGLAVLLMIALLPFGSDRPDDPSLPATQTGDDEVEPKAPEPAESDYASLPPAADRGRPQQRPGGGIGPLSLPLSPQQIDRIATTHGIRKDLLLDANGALGSKRANVQNRRYLTLIDYRLHSSQRRMYVVDLASGTVDAMHVAHGMGSDTDHDGWADDFSNRPGSKMSSLGAYVTGQTYQGSHGLSLRLKGLDATNLAAEERAIVMHGADYVDGSWPVLGRSWGCPAIETRLVAELIPKLAGGTFLFIAN